ncbi:MAG: hypothetical protein E6J14_11915 [Chloroflexi bacterium]|nr:MAG: hypothetical protein E6J14_11915 [Chloroflexota bacterium]
MTRTLRRRVLILQVGLIGILGFVAGFLFWANSFSHGMVRDQLSAQQIYFPPAGSQALNPQEFPDLQQYAGQQVVNGDQAKAYADGFIGRHLQAVAGGQTYAQVSTKSLANPTDTKLAGQVQTLFRGETLRGLLLNAYGWWQVGQYAFYAAVGLVVAAIAVFGALIFELWRWAFAVRKERPILAPTTRTMEPRPTS